MGLFTLSRVRVRLVAAGAAVALFAQAGLSAVVPLGNSGWEAIWDSSLDPFVSINTVAVIGNAVFIQKSAEFTQGPDVNGLFPTIPIVFRQTSAGAVSNIVIEDEIITNSTGSPWFDFHMDLLNGNDAFFDPAATAASGGPGPIGFSIAPFTTAAFSNNNQRLDIAGGTVPAGGVWFPGSGALNGQLWINATVAAQAPFTVFTLKETPTIPEPAGLAMLAVGGLVLVRRRR